MKIIAFMRSEFSSNPARIRRRRGATLGLVAILVLLIILAGIGFFFFVKVLGGGRELANATDSGIVNVAKHALRDPSKDALSFSNPDVGTNFAVYGESPHNLNLLNYNRLVMHAAIVAFNARSEGTSQAAQNAKKVWTALNDVAKHIRTTQENAANMGGYFNSMAGSNNVKMLGQNGVSLQEYDVAYMKKGGSANILLDNAVLTAAGAANEMPSSDGSSGGKKFLAGYKPFSVSLSSGETLIFSAVTNCPGDRSHLVTWTDFEKEKTDSFMTGRNYPANTLPPNSYRAGSHSKESKTALHAGAMAAAMVGTLDHSYPMNMQYGYLIIRNGPSAPGPSGPMALEGNDIFCHKLAKTGLDITGTDASSDFFTVSDYYPVDQLKAIDLDRNGDGVTSSDEIKFFEDNVQNTEGGKNLIDWWAFLNTNGYSASKEVIDRSLEVIKWADGRAVTLADLKSIRERTHFNCRWWHYDDDSSQNNPECMALINGFKRGYNEYGSVDGSPNLNEHGFTAMEQFKCNVQAARTNCNGCVTVNAPAGKSGVKWFDHSKKYAAPAKAVYNFGVPKSPYDYLQMIDKVSNGCGAGGTLDHVLSRAREINPSMSKDSLIDLLKSETLPLGATLYIYNGGGSMKVSSQPPSWIVPNQSPDGATAPCGTAYDVLGTKVNTSSQPPNGPIQGNHAEFQDPDTDGLFPGWNYRISPPSQCTDQAIWTPSTGYNHLLGVLDFSNSCSGGGRFCEPN